MALKTYASQADVPEALRSEYVEKDGRWIPNVENAEDIYAGGLKRSQQELLKDLKTAQAKLKSFDGVDPEEHQRLKDAAKAAQDAMDEAEREKQKTKGDWEGREKSLKAQFEKDIDLLKKASAKEIEKSTARGAKQDSFIRRLLVENKVREVFGPLLVSPEVADVMMAHLSTTLRVVEDGDNWKSEVLDGNGQPRIKDSQGNPFTIEDLAKEMSGQDRYASFFKGTGASGSGARGSGSGAKGQKVIPAGNTAAFLDNLDDIASGKAVVADA